MVAIVFGGPSLQGIDYLQKDVIILPPAAQGDLLRFVRELHPTAVGLLDCDLPYKNLPTWHKEIIYVLSCGIPVVGASAVGAHRAVELAPYGMKGVGSIFLRVASGELERDDEVLGDWEMTSEGLRRLSLPLVIIRDAVAAARDGGVISGKTAESLIVSAEGLFWRRRSWDVLLGKAQHSGLSAGELEAFRTWLPDAPDPVRSDSEALLARVIELAATPMTEKVSEQKESSSLFKSLEQRDRPVSSRSGPVRQWCIGDMVSFSHPEAEDLNGRALNRKLTLLLATLWNIAPQKKDIEAEEKRLRRRFKLKSGEEFSQWMQENDLDAEELNRLLEEEALIHRLHRWFMQGRIHGKNTGAILDELKLRGGYVEWKEKAARREKLLRDNENILMEQSNQVTFTPFMKILREHLRAEGFPWHGTMLLDAMPETGMESQDLVNEIMSARVARTLLSQAFIIPSQHEDLKADKS